MAKRTEKEHSVRRKTTLSGRLFRVISVILVLAIFAIVFATDRGLDLIYLISAGLSTWQASDSFEAVYQNDPEHITTHLDDIESEFDVSVEIYEGNDKLVYASYYKGEMTEGPYDGSSPVIPESARRDYEVVDNAGSFNTGTHYELRSLTNEAGTTNDYLVFVKSLGDGLTINIYKLKSPVDANSRIAVVFVSITATVFMVVAMVLIFKLVRVTTEPIREMSDVTRNLSNLDFSQKCKPNNIKELSLLSESINDMSGSLETALEDLRAKNEKLLKDIEQEKTIEQLRNVFISGVSHELKTPIAIISGYAEGVGAFLDMGDYEKAKSYANTIISETDRMNALVMKLLEVIKYESGEYQPLEENLRVSDIIDDWLVRNTEILAQNEIEPLNLIDPDFIATADPFMASTVVNNYLSNALSHVSGEKKIIADAKREGDRIRISIFNTGERIAEKDIDKIWDSFYRADKSLSRSQGRFGLGLAVVAAIQRLQNMSFGVRNHDDGVEFWFDLKLSDAQLPDGEEDYTGEVGNI